MGFTSLHPGLMLPKHFRTIASQLYSLTANSLRVRNSEFRVETQWPLAESAIARSSRLCSCAVCKWNPGGPSSLLLVVRGLSHVCFAFAVSGPLVNRDRHAPGFVRDPMAVGTVHLPSFGMWTVPTATVLKTTSHRCSWRSRLRYIALALSLSLSACLRFSLWVRVFISPNSSSSDPK